MTAQKQNITTKKRSFSFNKENMAQVDVILKKYPETRKSSAVMPLLDMAQHQNGGWLSPDVILYIAGVLDMPEIRVWEVASFYTMYNLHPIGKHHVQVCTTTPCWLRGSDKIMRVCQKWLGVEGGGTTSDGQFTLTEVECLGACANAPVVTIGDAYYEDLDEGSICQVLEALADGKQPKSGSQIGRISSEPDVSYLKEKI